MAVIKLTIDTTYRPANKNIELEDIVYPLVIHVSHRKVRKNIPLGYKLRMKDWDDYEKKITRSYPNSQRENFKVSKQWAIALGVIAYPKEYLKKLTAYEIADIIKKQITEQIEEESQNPLSLVKSPVSIIEENQWNRAKKIWRKDHQRKIRKS